MVSLRDNFNLNHYGYMMAHMGVEIDWSLWLGLSGKIETALADRLHFYVWQQLREHVPH